MPTTRIYLGDAALDKKQAEALKLKFDKKVLQFQYEMDETVPDGRFVSTLPWNQQLWTTIGKEIGFPGQRKALKVTDGIVKPGNYNVEIEVNGSSYQGKIVFKQKPGDTSMPVMKPGTNPKKVNLKVAGANKNKLPKDLHGDLDKLLAIMQKPQSYSWVGGSGSHKGWKLDFGKHHLHEQPGKGWKAYIDVSQGTGSSWRLYFNISFDPKTGILLVSLTNIQQDH